MTNLLGVEVTRPTQELIIMRGISGSGKSTKAKTLKAGGVIHSTDDEIEKAHHYRDFFNKMHKEGDFSPLSRMHSLNLKNAIKSMQDGVTPVIIDNTNLKANEPKAYVQAALRLGYDTANIYIVDVGTGGLNAEDLAKRNSHGVPLDKIQSMIMSYNSVGPLTIKKILDAKDMYKESDILYSAVVLDNRSKTELLFDVEDNIPDDWKVFAHHMTIVFGKGLPNDLKQDLGKTVPLTVTHLGISDMAIAVKVDGYKSANAIPHITIAVNPNGGKPVMSNDIKNWQPIKNINLTGVVTEIKKN